MLVVRWLANFGGTSGKQNVYHQCSVQRAQVWPKSTGSDGPGFAQTRVSMERNDLLQKLRKVGAELFYNYKYDRSIMLFPKRSVLHGIHTA